MFWSRARHRLLFAVSTLACLPLVWRAWGAGEVPGGVRNIVALAHAGNAARAQEVLAAVGGANLGAVARAVEWDFAFIAAYVLALGLGATWLAYRTTGWRSGAALGAAVLFALVGFFDACENLGVLLLLEGPTTPIAANTAFLALAKWASLAGGVSLWLAAAIAAATGRRQEAPPSLPWVLPAEPGELLRCDVVMKGGITSGVVYPGAVHALARRYRFMNIGGSSAGAIAAAVTAAAEYRRQSGGGNAGFAALREATEGLAVEDRLFRLFQPTPATAPLFDLAAAALQPAAGPVRLVWLLWTAAAVFPAATLAALALPLGLLLVASADVAPRAAAWLFAAGGVLVVVAWLVAVVAAVVRLAMKRVPANGFGLCPGPAQGGRAGPGLSDWLADTIDRIAFGERWEEEGPLTLGHLWRGRPLASGEAPGPVPPEARKLNLEVLTTSLTHGRPYRIPFEGIRLWFRAEDLEAVLPARVVNAMVRAAARVKPRGKLPPLGPGLYPLPDPDDLPVVFLARMSLSFPGLLTATRLHGLRAPPEVPPGSEADGAGPEAESRTGELMMRMATYEPHWFSDGGISSNFPIHFFDQPLPQWPTFGLDLGERAPGQRRIELARDNKAGILAPWLVLSGLPGFAGALVGALQAWLDNLQKRAPGYRDRIVRVNLDPDEGGLNLRMPRERILRIARYGHAAGSALGARFDPRPAAPDEGAQAGEDAQGRGSRLKDWAWNNHRWVRLRSTLALLEGALRDFALRYPAPVAHTRSFDDLVQELGGRAPSYRYPNAQLRDRAKALAEAIGRLPLGEGESLSEDAPRPRPELRIVPKV